MLAPSAVEELKAGAEFVVGGLYSATLVVLAPLAVNGAPILIDVLAPSSVEDNSVVEVEDGIPAGEEYSMRVHELLVIVTVMKLVK